MRVEEVTTADDEILIRHRAPNIPDSSFNQRGGAGISLYPVGVGGGAGGGENIFQANAPIFADLP